MALLTLCAMHTAWGTSSIDGGLGFYPGVELRAKEGADAPFEYKEIDLVAMRGGDLILDLPHIHCLVAKRAFGAFLDLAEMVEDIYPRDSV